jgi:PBP1b-binding outer membrane lipoprotein LpoB
MKTKLTKLMILAAILLLASCVKNELEKAGYDENDAVLMTDSKGNTFVITHDIGAMYHVQYLKP